LTGSHTGGRGIGVSKQGKDFLSSRTSGKHLASTQPPIQKLLWERGCSL
jgi:hypothetical protein